MPKSNKTFYLPENAGQNPSFVVDGVCPKTGERVFYGDADAPYMIFSHWQQDYLPCHFQDADTAQEIANKLDAASEVWESTQ